jgi:hypothetical protein
MTLIVLGEAEQEFADFSSLHRLHHSGRLDLDCSDCARLPSPGILDWSRWNVKVRLGEDGETSTRGARSTIAQGRQCAPQTFDSVLIRRRRSSMFQPWRGRLFSGVQEAAGECLPSG